MNQELETLQTKALHYLEKYQDQELFDYMMSLAKHLEDADMLKSQLSYLLMHARATVAAPQRTVHFQEALLRADRFIKKLETRD